MTVDSQIRSILAGSGHLLVEITAVDGGEDLYDLGLTSHGTVAVMLELEDAFDTEFPDEMLRADTFRSIDAMRHALANLGVSPG